MTWKYHVNKLSSKINRTIGIIKSIKALFNNKGKTINLQLIDTFTTSFWYSNMGF